MEDKLIDILAFSSTAFSSVTFRLSRVFIPAFSDPDQ